MSLNEQHAALRVAVHAAFTGYRVVRPQSYYNAESSPTRCHEVTTYSCTAWACTHPAFGIETSDPSNEEPFAAAPVQLDPEFGPNASRRSSEERRRAQASGDRELGLIGPETSPQQLRRLPLELPSDWLRMGRFLQSDAANVFAPLRGEAKVVWAHCFRPANPNGRRREEPADALGLLAQSRLFVCLFVASAV